MDQNYYFNNFPKLNQSVRNLVMMQVYIKFIPVSVRDFGFAKNCSDSDESLTLLQYC
jgi:hypothetical protein